MLDADNLEKLRKEMYNCIRCAYCFEECPVIRESVWDSDGARGKVILSYGLLSGELEPSEYLANKLYQCTMCRDCMNRCPSKVNILEIISSARADLAEAGFAGETHKHIINNIKKTGNIYGDDEVTPPKQEGEIPLFLGCQYQSRPNKTKKFIRILEKIGIKPMVQDEFCCGFPMEILGFRTDFEEHKEKFLQTFDQKEAMAICPTCTLFLNEGYDIKTKHILQVIQDYLPEANLGLKVTYHDPCDFSRGLGIIEEPREILRKLGVEIIEMKNCRENSGCCGGGGGILMTDQDLSNDISLHRIQEAIDTGADIVVTSCPTCEQVLKKAAKQMADRDGKTIVVRNIEDIIWKGLKQ